MPGTALLSWLLLSGQDTYRDRVGGFTKAAVLSRRAQRVTVRVAKACGGGPLRGKLEFRSGCGPLRGKLTGKLEFRSGCGPLRGKLSEFRRPIHGEQSEFRRSHSAVSS